jgi:hypothetical protein
MVVLPQKVATTERNSERKSMVTTQKVIELFGNIKEKHRLTLISFDVLDFYTIQFRNIY